MDYFVMRRNNQRGMLLYSLQDPSDDDDWFLGCRFKSPPSELVEVEIQAGYERADEMPFFGSPPIMSTKLLDILIGAGVDNLDVYPAVLRSEDGTVRLSEYVAYNVIGLVEAADPLMTQYDEDNPSRLIDASIESLTVNASAVRGPLLFRLAEASGTILVHRTVKLAVEMSNIPFIAFQDPSDLVT